MSRNKKTSKAGALKGFQYEQPFIGFRTQFRTVPIEGKGKVKTHKINYGCTCREELVWDSREFLQEKCVNWKKKRGSWERTSTLVQTLDLNHASLKQPEATYLWVNGEEDYDGNYYRLCKKPCCIELFPEVLDAIVGPAAVLLNPDRYVGDWWITSPEEISEGDELRWYGTDNFFLRHPVLTSLMMGMFRQGVLLFQQDFSEAILKAVKKKDVEDCLTNADPVLAMRLMRSLRPWIEVKNSRSDNFAFGKGHWNRLELLHRSIYKHGYQALFDADPQQSWNIGNATQGGGRYGVANGPMQYWGTADETVAGKRLAKLGK